MYTDFFPPSRLNPGRAIFVAPLDNDRSGLAWNTARNSIQSAVDIAVPNDTIYVAPGTYTENVIVPYGFAASIIGVGPVNSCILVSTTAGGTTLTLHAYNSLVQNLYVQGPDTTTGIALRVTAVNSVFRGCKFGAGFQQAVVGPGLDANVSSSVPTESGGSDIVFSACEFSDGPHGVVFHGTDYGPANRIYIVDSIFNKLSTSSLEEENASGSTGSQFRNILVKDCTFMPALTGTEPTNYFLLNDSNSNTGVVTGCRFTVALTSTKNLVSTKLIWVGNLHPAALSSGQPS